MIRVIGVDPGPTPGFVRLDMDAYGRFIGIDVVQCSAKVAPEVIGLLLGNHPGPTSAQIEKFVPGRKSRAGGRASSVTRDMVGLLEGAYAGYLGRIADVTGQCPAGKVVQRSASEVKPWATDERLDTVGLLDATKGMRHARDAARHALFLAVKSGHLPDPLSKRSTA